ncbi:hypothetical protein Tco_0375202 [Tanacetum coccineum]
MKEITIKEYLAMEMDWMAKQKMNSSSEKLWYLAEEDEEEESYVFDMNEFPAIQFRGSLSSNSEGTNKSLDSTLDEKYNAITCDFSPELELLLASESHIAVPVCSIRTVEEKLKIDPEKFNLLEIDDDLFTYNTPLGVVFDEFKRLSSMEDDLFTYELGIVEDRDKYIPLQTPLCKAFKEFNYLLQIDVDVLTGDIPGFKVYEDYKDTWIYEWNKEVPWIEEKPWLEDGTFKEPTDDIDYVCRPFHFKSGHIDNMIHSQNYEWYEGLKDCELKDEALKEKLMTLLQEYWWGKKGDEESSDDDWSHYSPTDEWKDYEHTTFIETDVNSNHNTHLDVCQIFNTSARTNNDGTIQANQECLDEREPNDNDDDINDLDDYLIHNDAPFIFNEEE